MNKDLAELLVKMRQHKIKQKQIAEHLGITDVYLSMILNGKKNPKNFKERFAKAVDEIIASKI